MRKGVLRLACAVAGLAVLGTLGAVGPASAAPPRRGTFTALTYNVAGLPQAMSGSDPETNSPLISPKLNDYDLVLLQENWADPAPGVELFFHDEITAEARHPYRSQPAPTPVLPDPRRFPTGPALLADGLNRLSDFPFGPLDRQMWEACFGEFSMAAINAILDATGLDDPVQDAGLDDELDDGSADCGAQKGFSVARTTLMPGVEVDIYNLHADAGGDPRDQAARKLNFAQLASYIAQHSQGRPVILGGDTNLRTAADTNRPQDAAVWSDFLAATGLVYVCDVVDCGADDGAIDKFAFRSTAAVKIVPLSATMERAKFTRSDGEPLSDHDPLAVTFRWRLLKPRTP